MKMIRTFDDGLTVGALKQLISGLSNDVEILIESDPGEVDVVQALFLSDDGELIVSRNDE
jgi:hypothetical protein